MAKKNKRKASTKTTFKQDDTKSKKEPDDMTQATNTSIEPDLDPSSYAGAEADEEVVEAAGHEAGADGMVFELPSEYTKVSDDVAAYWDAAMGVVELTIEGIRLMDNSREDSRDKSSCLIIGTLAKSTWLRKSGATKEERVMASVPKGSTIGIWAKAGMRRLIGLATNQIAIAPAGKREMVGDKNPMQLFNIGVKGSPSGVTLPVIEDSRKASLVEPQVAQLSNKNLPWWYDALPAEARGGGPAPTVGDA